MRSILQEEKDQISEVEQNIRYLDRSVETDLEKRLISCCKALTNNIIEYQRIVEDAISVVEEAEEDIDLDNHLELKARIIEFKEILTEDEQG